ncbi:hypothetical protein NDU88_002924 [Pleurodeles waltl]|uniref:Uncharacterized protein n=1 Tax=Pleurodeles waltl TaxID=8319 RepID=A0AAV7WMW9_PLEWA|nr:hypothetical protein NDU88_002924 [Pleurodeles waltl]
MGTLRSVSGDNFLVQGLQEKMDYTQDGKNATEKEKPCEAVETETAVKDGSRTSHGADKNGAVSNRGEETRTRDMTPNEVLSLSLSTLDLKMLAGPSHVQTNNNKPALVGLLHNHMYAA